MLLDHLPPLSLSSLYEKYDESLNWLVDGDYLGYSKTNQSLSF